MSTSQFWETARGGDGDLEDASDTQSSFLNLPRHFYLFPIMAQRQKYNGRLSQFLSKGLFCWRFGADSIIIFTKVGFRLEAAKQKKI